MENEIWKDITGYEGCYQVSNTGRVKSLTRYVVGRYTDRIVNEKILKPSIGTHGYYYISLYKNSIVKKYTIHRLVIKSFIENPKNKK